MSEDTPQPTERVRLRRKADRGRHDRATIDAVLDEAFICHVAFEHDGYVSVLPMAYGRRGDFLYVHGSAGNHMLRALRDGARACVCATLVDGLVLARSAFHHSANYRSVVIYARGEEVKGESEKGEALRWIVDHVVPGRSEDTRGPSADEIKQTIVIRFSLAEASAKIRTGPPLDSEDDIASPYWAGVVPLDAVAGTPIPAPDLLGSPPIPPYVRSYRRPARNG